MKESMGQPVQGTVAIEQLPEMQAVYVRHIGTYESLAREYSQLIQTLFARAGELDLLAEKNSWVFAIYHDNPEFGEEEQYRTSLCLTVPIEKQIEEDEVLGKMMLEGGSYAVGHFRITQEQYPMMWDYMYQEWLCGSGYEPRNSYPFEVYRNNPAEDADHMHEVDLYLPIDLI